MLNNHNVYNLTMDCQNNTVKDLAFHSQLRHCKDIH